MQIVNTNLSSRHSLFPHNMKPVGSNLRPPIMKEEESWDWRTREQVLFQTFATGFQDMSKQSG
jgi:hypothetical protein